MLTSERLHWEGMARQRAAGSGNPGELLCHRFTVSGFRIMGFVSRLSLACHLACAYIWYDRGPSWRYTCLSAKVDSNMRASWRLAGHIMGLQRLPPFGSSQILSAFSSSTMFLMGTSCCETTCEDASGHCCTWTKQVVSISASLTPLTISVLRKWNLSFKRAK